MVLELLQRVPVFVLVFFRLAGIAIFAPLFGSAMIPRRIKVMLILVLSMGVMSGVNPPLQMPATTWELTVGIAGEMVFGIAMGMVLSFVFIAAQWAGEIIGQQMGINLGASFDPQFGGGGSLIGDLYFMLTLIVFLTIPVAMGGPGHHAMLRGVRASFDALPLLSIGMTASLFDLIVGLFQAATSLAIQLAAPTLVTMLVVDLALGLIGKTMPQINVMSSGLSMRSAVGLVILIVGLALSNDVIRTAMLESMEEVRVGWVTAGS